MEAETGMGGVRSGVSVILIVPDRIFITLF
jgi:hypothetical protein